jgi:hypothetical protein
MKVKERLKTYVKTRQMSERAFCLSIGVGCSYINSIKVSIAPDKLERIAQVYLDLNLTWLMTGQGEMLNNTLTMLQPWQQTEPNNDDTPDLPLAEQMVKLQSVVIQAQNHQIRAMINAIAKLEEQLAACQTQLNENQKT